MACIGGDDEQKWSINNDGSITNYSEDFCIDIPNCSNNAVQVEVYKYHLGSSAHCGDSKNQEWTFKSDGTIVSKLNNKFLKTYDFHEPVVETYNCRLQSKVGILFYSSHY